MSGEFFYSTAADLVRRKPVSRNSIKEFVNNCLQIAEERNKLRIQKKDLRAELEARDSEIAMLKRMVLESENKNAELERQLTERGEPVKLTDERIAEIANACGIYTRLEFLGVTGEFARAIERELKGGVE